jgi:hypothetical protein
MKALSRLGLGAALLMAALLTPPPAAAGEAGGVLVVANPLTGLRAELPLAGVKRITIRFFHSYDRQWVSESFKVARGRLVPVEVDYADDSYDYRDQRYQSRAVVERGQVRLTAIEPAASDRLERIITRVAFTKPQQLILSTSQGQQSTPFTQWGAPGQRLIFYVE